MILRFILFLALLLAGCGSDDAPGSVSGGGNPPVVPVQALTRADKDGLFVLPQVSGRVALEGAGGAEITVRDNLVEARLTNGVILQADLGFAAADRTALGGRTEGPNFLWVTPVSTLAAAEKDLKKVKHYLGIHANESVNRPFNSHPLSQFSPLAFQRAAQGRPLPEFARSLVPEIEQGLVRPFKTGSEIRGKLFGAPETLGQPLLDNLYGGGLTLTLATRTFGWVGSLFGLGTGTQQQLQAIQNQLTQIQNQITVLGQTIAQSFLRLDISSSVSAIANYTATQNSVLQSDLLTYVPFSADNTFLGNIDGQSWTNPQNISSAVSAAYNILSVALDTGPTAGQGNLLTYQLENTAVNVSGSGPYTSNSGSVWYNFYDFRNDLSATPQVANVTNWYATEIALASNWLSESATQALGANNVSAVPSLQRIGTNLNGSGQTQAVGQGLSSQTTTLGNGAAALSQRVSQMGPMALLGGQSALGAVCGGVNDPESQSGTGSLNGSLWTHYATVTQEGGGSGFYGPSPFDCRNFSINGWYDWYLPTEDEVKALFSHAERLAGVAGIKGNNAVAYGLQQMGLISPSDYQNALSNGGTIWVYSDFSIDSKQTPHLYTTGSNGDHNDNGTFTVLAEGQTLIDPGVQLRVLFKPMQTGVALLIRPLPGAPKGSTTVATIPPDFNNPPNTGPASAGQASQSGAPAAVVNSNSAQALGGSPWYWNTDLALACSFIPDEVVVQADSANPQQLHAYGIWTVSLKGAPSSYRSNAYENPGQGYSGVIGNFGYPQTPFAPSYLIWTEISEQAEWLSSNTAVAEVSNYDSPTVTMLGANVAGASGTVSILNNTIATGALTAGTVSGGRTLNGPAFAGALPVNTTLEGATLSGGTLTTTSTNILLNPQDGSQAGTITNGTVSGATFSGGLMTVPSPGALAGWVNPHQAGQPATISASMMYSPTTETSVNDVASVAAFRTGTLPFTASAANTTPASLILSPNFNKVLNAPSVTFYLTATNFDGTFTDLTATATLPQIAWKAFLLTDGTPRSAPGLAFSTDAGGANILNIPSGFSGYVAVQATYQGLTAWSFLNLINSGGGTALPVITNLIPATGPVAGGTTVTLIGRNFTGVSAVTVGGRAASFSFVADGQISVVTPPGATTGPAAIIVTTPGGTSGAANFTYQ